MKLGSFVLAAQMKESMTYQKILADGREEGIAQGVIQGVAQGVAVGERRLFLKKVERLPGQEKWFVDICPSNFTAGSLGGFNL